MFPGHLRVSLPFWASHPRLDGTGQRGAETGEGWPRGAADGSEFCFSVLGVDDGELEPEDIIILEAAYVRRLQFEAKVNALALVETFAQVWMGTDGKKYREVSVEEGLARMGITL